jgi:hypothetical protein
LRSSLSAGRSEGDGPPSGARAGRPSSGGKRVCGLAATEHSRALLISPRRSVLSPTPRRPRQIRRRLQWHGFSAKGGGPPRRSTTAVPSLPPGSTSSWVRIQKLKHGCGSSRSDGSHHLRRPGAWAASSHPLLDISLGALLLPRLRRWSSSRRTATQDSCGDSNPVSASLPPAGRRRSASIGILVLADCEARCAGHPAGPPASSAGHEEETREERGGTKAVLSPAAAR